MAPAFRKVYDQMPEPRWVVSIFVHLKDHIEYNNIEWWYESNHYLCQEVQLFVLGEHG